MAADSTDAPLVTPPAAPPAADVAAPTPAVPAPDDVAVAPAGTNAPIKVVRQPNFNLPPLLDQVARLTERGTDEAVIKAYVQSAPAYRITGNDIIQLQDLGVSKDVILALVDHSKGVVVSTPDAAQPQPPLLAAQSPQANADGAVTPPATPPANDYYDALAPYGTWADVPGYGLCWQPTAAVVGVGWRPYCDYGDWLWTDCGWYWNSYYSWGWAPFHYGRWFCHGGRGWFWCPDRTWGPAWVCWRNSGAFCGWAALPPGAIFSGGRWSFHGAHVGVGFDFGLGFGAFTFVGHDHFGDRHVGRHAIAGSQAQTVFRGSTVVNNHTALAGNRLFNGGIGRDRIASAAQTPIRQASLTATPGRPGGFTVAHSGGGMTMAHNSAASVQRTTTASAGSRFSAPANQSMSRSFASPMYRNYSSGSSSQFGSRGPVSSFHAAPSYQTPHYATPPSSYGPRSFGSMAPSHAGGFSGGFSSRSFGGGFSGGHSSGGFSGGGHGGGGHR